MVKHGQIFSSETQAVFYNWKQKPIQRMLDFDYLCGESLPLAEQDSQGNGSVFAVLNCTAAFRRTRTIVAGSQQFLVHSIPHVQVEAHLQWLA